MARRAKGAIAAIGIDLAASPLRDTGICVIRGKSACVSIAHSDDEILSLVRSVRGRKIIGIDAPLSLPPGRKSIDDRGQSHFRDCDLELRNRGIRFFPITLGPMRMLTKRGMNLAGRLAGEGNAESVNEVYPGASYDICGIPRKNQRRILAWARKSVRLGRKPYAQDELDAVAAAITIKLHILGKSDALGSPGGHCIIVPKDTRARKRAKA
ncbi:DUF429 domain-containing protein [Candidatus Micrarchaeota archaeon]|nr:DUF429 domain-containing protein [Candidatus Micrarchaeota archaeon]